MPGTQRSESEGTSRYGRLLVAILVLGFLVRIAAYIDLRANDPLFFRPLLDSEIFLDWASRIAGGDLFGDRVFFLNPLYPYLLAPVTAIAGAETLTTVRILQVLLGLGTIVLTAGAVRRLIGPGPALLTALLAALYPLLLYYEQLVMIVTVAVFLNALALRLLARLAERRTLGAAAIAGIPLGLAILARPNVALFGLLLPLWLLTLADRGRRLRFAVGRSAALLSVAALMVLPVTIRNWVVGKDLVAVTSSMGVNLYQTNNPVAWREGLMDSGGVLKFGPQELEDHSRTVAEAARGRSLKPSDVSSYWTERTVAHFRESPGSAFLFLGRKLFYFLQSPEFPSSHDYAGQREMCTILRWIPLTFGVVGPLALLGLLLVLTKRREGLPFVLLFLAYAVGLSIFFPLSHYRAPALPAAFSLAGLGASAILGALRDRNRRRSVVLIGSLVGILVFIQTPRIARGLGAEGLTGYEDAEGVFFMNGGLIFLKTGHLEQAEAQFRKALALGESPDKAHMALAEIANRRGMYADEVDHLVRLLEIDPKRTNDVAAHATRIYESHSREEGLRLAEAAAASDAATHLAAPFVRLGEIYEREGRIADAANSYRWAMTRGAPPWVPARLSRCLRRLGRPVEALSIVTEWLLRHPEEGPLNLERAEGLIAVSPDSTEEIRKALRAARAAGMKLTPELEARLQD